MSMETLKADLKANLSASAVLNPVLASTEELAKAIKEIWAFIESHVEETGDIDDCVGDILNNAEDILQPETAEVFAAIIAGSAVVCAALKARITREAEPMLYKAVEELEKNCKAGGEIMKEIVVDGGDEEGEDDEDDPDEEDEDDEIEGDGARP